MDTQLYANVINESARLGFYIKMPEVLDDYLSETLELSDGEEKVWRYLFKRARFNDDLSCKATKSQIAKGTRRKACSIYKMLRSLCEKDYLDIQTDYENVNTFFLKLPEDAILLLKNAPQREMLDRRSFLKPDHHLLAENVVQFKKALEQKSEDANLSTHNEKREDKVMYQGSGGAVPEQRGGCTSATGGLYQSNPLY